jgi:hypothetical protein
MILLYRTSHDLFAADANLPWLVTAQRRAGVRVDNLERRVSDDGTAGARLHLERLLAKARHMASTGPASVIPYP